MRLPGRRGGGDFDQDMFATMVEGMDKLTAAGLGEDDARDIAVNAWVQAADHQAPAVASTMRKTAPRMLRRRHRGYRPFRRALRMYWGRPLDLYLAICVGAHDAGKRFDDRLAAEAEERQDYHFEVLTGLYARACRTALEIHHALAGGYPMAALARCRTLHEIAVIMLVLTEFGETEEHADLAERFYLHERVLTAKDAKTYQEHCEQLGGEPLADEAIAELDQARRELLARFGTDYKDSYGWASGVDGLRRPNFAQLEKPGQGRPPARPLQLGQPRDPRRRQRRPTQRRRTRRHSPPTDRTDAVRPGRASDMGTGLPRTVHADAAVQHKRCLTTGNARKQGTTTPHRRREGDVRPDGSARRGYGRPRLPMAALET